MAPNVFLAIQITNQDLIRNLREAHFKVVMKDTKLKDFITPVETAHVTLNVFKVEKDRLEEAKKILKETFEANLDKFKIPEPITFKGLGMFGTSVLFVKPNIGVEFLHKANEVFKTALSKNNFEVTSHDSYNPHITIFQVSGGGLNSIPKETFKDIKDMEFGCQEVAEIQFLSMNKDKDSSGYYHCEDSYKLPG